VDDGIKQRLIGAVVLVALMVIFLPMFFSSSETEPVDILIEMPEKPPIPEFDISKPVKPSGQPADSVPEAEPAPAPAPEVAVEQQAEELKDKKVDDSGLPVSWALQVASFKERENAEKLRDKLRKDGFKAYIKYRLDVEPRLIRVFIGPVLERESIDKLKVDVSKQYQLDGVVVRYLP
jgi:DedD protein